MEPENEERRGNNPPDAQGKNETATGNSKISQPDPKVNSAHLTSVHRALLHGRGLTDETITQARLFSADVNRVTEILGFNPSKSGGVVIPYIDPVSELIWKYQVRFDSPVRINGRELKYLGAKNLPPRLYFPPGWKDILQSEAPLLITEGEFKALVAQQAGLPTISVAGVQGWRSKNNPTGASLPIPDFKLVQWEGRTVTLAFDNDIVDKEPVQKAQQDLANAVYQMGVRSVQALDLPYLEGAKVGLDDYLNLFGLDSLLALDTYELPSPFPPVKLWSGADLIAADMPRPEPIVPGWGFRRGGKGILVGMGGQGKTTVLTHVALDLAAGAPLFGYGPLAVSCPQRVAVYLAEDPLSEVRHRFSSQARELGYGPEVTERVTFLDFSGRRLSLENEADLTTFSRAVRDSHAEVAILDPLVAIHDSEENSNAAMRKVLDTLNPLITETGLAVLIAHHEPKSPETVSASPRGASAIRDWCRTMLRLVAHGKGESGATRFSLDLDKANYGGTVWSLILERKKDTYTFLVAVEKTAVTSMQIWELLTPEGCWFTDFLTELQEKFSISVSTAARVVKKAEEQSFVITGEKKGEKGKNRRTIRRGTGRTEENSGRAGTD